MLQNTQIPQLYTVSTGQTLTLVSARAVSILSDGGNSTIVNSSNQTMTLPDGATLEVQADGGNTLGQLTITTSATALITSIGGVGQIT